MTRSIPRTILWVLLAGAVVPLAGAVAPLVGCTTRYARTHLTLPRNIVPLTQVSAVPSSEADPAPPAPARSPWLSVGTSQEERPIQATTRGNGLRRVLVIGSIHGNETEGLSALDGVLADISEATDLATWLVVRDMNPDGTAEAIRTNANGVDLNRNWPAANFRPGRARGRAPLSEPETRVVHELFDSFDPDLVVVFHSIRRGPFVNHDGPLPLTRRLAQAFAEAASEQDRRWKVVDSMGYPTPGSVGSYVGLDRKTPILTIEFDRGHSTLKARAAAASGLIAACRELDNDRPQGISVPGGMPGTSSGVTPSSP
ncbi:MAG: M14 family zinc carboxypeptidase [Planctomycetota bacterium]|jgi:predicted deacylase